MEEHNICNIIKDDINILFLGEMTSGKTTLISCILNKLVGVIKRTGGTDKINIYNYGNTTDNIKISNDKYIFEKVENCDIKINNMKLNLIDTIGLNNLEHIEYMKHEIDNIIEYIDLIIYLIDYNTHLNSISDNHIKFITDKFKNVLFVINKFNEAINDDSCDNSHNIKKYITEKYGTTQIVSLSADDILIYKSILHRFTDKLNERKIISFTSLYGTMHKSEVLEKICYTRLMTEIYKMLDMTTIINNKLKINLKNTTRITNLIDYIQNINKIHNNIVNHEMCYTYIEHICEKLTNSKEIYNMLYGLYNNIEYLKQNNIVSNYICRKLVECISSDKTHIVMNYKIIYELGRLSIIPDIFIITLHHVIYRYDIVKHFVMLLYNYLYTIIYYFGTLTRNYLKYIDKIIYTLYTYEFSDHHNTNIIVHHIITNFDKYTKYFPLTSKLRYIREHRHDILDCDSFSYETPTINLVNYLLQIKTTNTLKQQFIYKLHSEKFKIFPCFYKHTLYTVNNMIYKFNECYTTQTSLESIKFIKYPLKYTEYFEYISQIDKQYIESFNKLEYIQVRKSIEHNIGLFTGNINKIFVLDITKENNGIDYWNNILKQYNNNNDINTIIVNTGGNGKQYYFTNTNTDKFFTKHFVFSDDNFNKIGIHVKNNNSFVLAPYSADICGNIYTFNNKYITNNNIIECIRNHIINIPDWLHQLLEKCYSVLDCNKLCYEDNYEKKLYLDFKRAHIYEVRKIEINEDFFNCDQNDEPNNISIEINESTKINESTEINKLTDTDILIETDKYKTDIWKEIDESLIMESHIDESMINNYIIKKKHKRSKKREHKK